MDCLCPGGTLGSHQSPTDSPMNNWRLLCPDLPEEMAWSKNKCDGPKYEFLTGEVKTLWPFYSQQLVFWYTNRFNGTICKIHPLLLFKTKKLTHLSNIRLVLCWSPEGDLSLYVHLHTVYLWPSFSSSNLFFFYSSHPWTGTTQRCTDCKVNKLRMTEHMNSSILNESPPR